MAPKDYVARDRVPAKKSTGSKASGSTKRSPKGNQRKTATANVGGAGRAAAKSSAETKRASSSKASGATRNSVAAQNTSVPKFRIAVTLLVLVGFGVFLWNIKDSAETRRAEVQETSASSQASADKKDDLPEMPKEEWEFMTTLTDPNYEVPVEMPEPIEQSDKEYVLQCGSFRKMDQADAMRARIILQGIEANIKESNGNNGRWYRVVMGPYDRKRAA